MLSLFISTYNSFVIIGLYKDGKIISKAEIESEKGHSMVLVPTIDKILKDNKKTTKDLSEIIIVNGPGSFTGVRLGITVAKTLAYTLNIPIKTISSIEAIAYSIKEEHKIIAISDNKGKYVGIFDENKLLNEINYFPLNKYQELIENPNYKDYIIIEDGSINLDDLYKYIINRKVEKAHSIKSLYVKEIEVLNGK